VREDVELEVVAAVGELVEPRQGLLERVRPVLGAQAERGHHPQRRGRDDAEGAEAHPRGAQLVAARGAVQHAPVGEDELQLLDLRGEVAQPRTGAVGGGGDRAGHALAVDVAQVGQREPDRVEGGVQGVQPDAGPHPHQTGRPVHGEHLGEPVELQQHAVGRDEVGEGMAGAGHPHGPPARGALPYGGGQLLHRARPDDDGRAAAFVAGPVDPRHAEQDAGAGPGMSAKPPS
jgi:hypothetical protein